MKKILLLTLVLLTSVALKAQVQNANFSISPAAFDPSDEITITVSNAGADTATNVEVLDQLPSGYTYQSDDAGGNYNPATGIWTTGSVTTATNQVLNITATVNAPTGTSNEYLNTAEVSNSDQADPNSDPDNDDGDQSEDDEDNAEITLELADLQITKSVLPLSGSVGDTVTFSIFLENFGPGDATGIDIAEKAISQIAIYPNPVSDRLHIKTGAKIKAVHIYNMQGQEVGTLNLVQGTNQINITALEEGMYFIDLEFENDSRKVSFIKR